MDTNTIIEKLRSLGYITHNAIANGIDIYQQLDDKRDWVGFIVLTNTSYIRTSNPELKTQCLINGIPLGESRC